MFMLGHIGASAVAAVGLSNQAVMIVTTFFAAVATGVTALVARHTGVREPEDANHVLHQGYLLGVLMGIAGTVLSIAFAEPMMHLLRAPADVVAPGTAYLRIAAVPFILTSWLFIGNAALRGAGDTRSPMMVMFFVNIVNIIVAYSFIYGIGPLPEMGVAGSAMGAAAGRGVGGLLVLALLLRGRDGLRLRLRDLLPDMLQMKRIANIGIPAGAEQLLMRFGMTAYMGHRGGAGHGLCAAHQLALQGESIAFMPGFGLPLRPRPWWVKALAPGGLSRRGRTAIWRSAWPSCS